MAERLLQVYRNTPFGREVLLQSLHFCKTVGVDLHIYIPESKQFLMYFDHDVVQVDLDSAYLISPKTAEKRAKRISKEYGITPTFFTPKNFTASQLPDIPTEYNYMCSPRTISDLSSKIGLGYIGPKVRRIIKSSTFPVLITGAVYKPWTSITVFYGGSNNANKALRWGLHLSNKSGLPLDMYTYTHGHPIEYFEEQLKEAQLWDQMQAKVRTWHKVEDGSFEENLHLVPHDAMIIVGAYGHGLIKEFLFGSKMETIQTWMPNNLLLVGPNCILGA